MKKIKTTKRNVGFEILTENEEAITFKRVLTKNRPVKDNRKIEMSLPKVTIQYFDEDDIERLNEIQIKLATRNKKNTTFPVSKILRNLLMK